MDLHCHQWYSTCYMASILLLMCLLTCRAFNYWPRLHSSLYGYRAVAMLYSYEALLLWRITIAIANDT